MRYLVMIAIALLCALITGGVSPQLTLIGAEADLVIVFMLAMELEERTVTPVIVFSVAAIFMDAFYAGAIGYYSFPYLVTGLLVYAVFAKKSVNAFFGPPLICAGAYIAKEIITGIIAFFLGNTFDFFYILVHFVLPGAALNAVLIFPAYLIMRLLYKPSFMAPRNSSLRDEFPGIKSFKKGGDKWQS